MKAVVVVREGRSLTAETVTEWCRELLAGFKRPRSVDFVAEMPRNPSGKVLKKELRALYWKDQKRGVS